MADLKSEKIDANDKPKVDLGLLEEDDEFEEFPADGKNWHIFSCYIFAYFFRIIKNKSDTNAWTS